MIVGFWLKPLLISIICTLVFALVYLGIDYGSTLKHNEISLQQMKKNQRFERVLSLLVICILGLFLQLSLKTLKNTIYIDTEYQKITKLSLEKLTDQINDKNHYNTMMELSGDKSKIVIHINQVKDNGDIGTSNNQAYVLFLNNTLLISDETKDNVQELLEKQLRNEGIW